MSRSYVYVGVDPGYTGAIASIETVLDELLISVHDMPIRQHRGRPRISRPGVVAILRDLLVSDTVIVAAVEAVGAMAKKGRKEGTSSMFRFGQGQGEVLGILAALGAIVYEVPPAVWKARAGLLGMGDKEVCERAVELGLAGRDTVFGPRGGPLHGRADALLLANHVMRLDRMRRKETEP